ncbi:hypothetical protein QTP88_000836 [Uroleucon formosanum]
MSVPRFSKKLINRDIYKESTPEAYYRKAHFIPFLDHSITDLKSKFEQHRDLILSFQNIMPNKVVFTNEKDVFNLWDFYKIILSDHQQFNSEYLLWKSKWVKEKEDCRPSSAFEAFLKCYSDFFPNIKQLLTIISTLPVSTTTVERTFSTLRRIKSYLRYSIGNERFTGIALLSVHREINIDPEEVSRIGSVSINNIGGRVVPSYVNLLYLIGVPSAFERRGSILRQNQVNHMDNYMLLIITYYKRNYLRMNADTFGELLEKIRPLIEKQCTYMRVPITAEQRLLSTLRYLVSGYSFEELKFQTAIAAPTLGKIIVETCEALIYVLKGCIKASFINNVVSNFFFCTIAGLLSFCRTLCPTPLPGLVNWRWVFGDVDKPYPIV